MWFLSPTRNWRALIFLAISGGLATVLFAAWTNYTNYLAEQAVYPFTELRLSHSRWIRYWFFGDLDYRLNPVPWARGAWRFLHATLGSLALVALLLPALLKRGNPLPKMWLASALITTLIFTNVVLAHWHYYVICSPAIAMLCAITATHLEDRLWPESKSKLLTLSLVGLVLVLSSIEGLTIMKVGAEHDPFTEKVSNIIREHSKPADKLLVHNYHLIWGGEVLFRSNRKGLVVSCLQGSDATPSKKGLYDLLNDPSDLNNLKSLGFNKLVLISESPLQYGLVMTSFSGETRQRGLYPRNISPEVDTWPAVYESDDLVIKTIR